MIVAPLTNALMGSIPPASAGLGSAINNSISRVGQPLLGAIIFIIVSATFYATLGGLVPGLDTSDPATRDLYPPLNPPASGVSEAEAAAAREASIVAFHQAMVFGAALLAIGAAVSWVGLRERAGRRQAEGDATAPQGAAAGAGRDAQDPAT